MTKTETKQLRKAKAETEAGRRYKVGGPWTTYWLRTRQVHLQKRIAVRLHFLITEGRLAFWFRKRGVPGPTADNVREDLISLNEERRNGGPVGTAAD